MSAVPLRNIVDPYPLVINQSCTVQTGKNMYNGLAIQMGAYSVHTPAAKQSNSARVGQMLSLKLPMQRVYYSN